MGRPTRLADVARAAGVSMGTVSHVLNNTANVSPQTRAKVEQAIAELGFVRNGAARSLAAGTSSMIGVVVVDLSNSFFLDMIRGAEEESGAAGMNVLMANSAADAGRQQLYLDLFVQERVAGILVAPGHDVDAPAPPVAGGRRPYVVLNSAAPGPHVCSVSTDNELGGYLATRHLIETGRRRLLFAGSDRFAAVRDRLRGARRAVDETGGAVTLAVDLRPGVRVEDGRAVGEAVDELAARAGGPVATGGPVGPPDGVVAGADLMALGVVQSLLVGGRLRVPQDVAVVGYDNNRTAWSSIVPISTIDQNGEEMGRAATRLLLDELHRGGDHEHTTIRLEPRLIARESTLGR